jgi:type IV pilus assembly protein PilW
MKKQSGMSLIELLVSMVILAIVMAGVAQYIANQTKLMRQDEMLANMQQNVRAAMDVVSRDIRSAEYDTYYSPSSSPFRKFNQANANLCIFYTNLNNNAAIDTSSDQTRNETKGFRGPPTLVGDSVQTYTNLPGNWQSMAKNIESLTFRYFDKNDVEIATPVPAVRMGDIFSVQIRIVGVTPRPWTRQPVFYPKRELKTKVQIRSRQGV